MLIRSLIIIAGLLLTGLSAWAQTDETAPGMKTVAIQEDTGAIALYEGPVLGGGTKLAEVWTDIGSERWARNVSQPTLLPVLPDADKATGAAVVLVPGGAFQFVSIDNEGYRVAGWLAEQGIAAFILKYRTMETPAGNTEFAAFNERLFAPATEEERVDMRAGIPLAMADTQAALELVEARAAEWNIDTDRIGLLGFSAGAIASLAIIGADESAAKPDFLGYIYGPMTPVALPDAPPPAFIALAADDQLFGGQGYGLVSSWREAGAPVEFHLYETGGHGFGSYKRGVTADAWFDQFIGWMSARGLLKPVEAD